MSRLCTEPGCERPHIARGLCTRHYQSARKAGLPTVLVYGRLCSVAGCSAKHLANGLCRAHYLRLYRHSDLNKRSMHGENLVARIMAKVRVVESGCWIFTGCLTENGYGHIRDGRKMVMAHLALYEKLRKPVSDGLELDHVCRVRSCVNPDHVEEVTHQVNVQRGLAGHDWPTRERNALGQFAGNKGVLI